MTGEHEGGDVARNGRTIVGVVACVVAIISLGALWYVSSGAYPYLVKLVLWFVSCLSGCHALFAFEFELTERAAKVIDYVYLGVASVGVLYLALGYSDQRTEFQKRYEKAGAQLQIGSRKALAEDFSKRYAELACKIHSSVREKHCERAKELFASLKAASSEKELSSIVDDFKGFLFAEIPDNESKADGPVRETGRPNIPIDEPTEYLTISLAISTISAIENTILAIKGNAALPEWSPSGKQEPSYHDLYFGLVQTAFWPFILAFALALRITKVTIDVFDWAR